MKWSLRTNVALVIGFACLVFSEQALAVPGLQVHIDGGIAGDRPQDADTWFFTGTTFDLFVVAKTDVTISGVTLVVSVPQGERGTISFDTGDETPLLATTAGAITSGLNPASGATADILTDVGGLDGYGDKADFTGGANLNNHDPFKDGLSDFLLFDLGSFDASETLYDYNASDGTKTLSTNEGEQKEYKVSFAGFSQLHFDVIRAYTVQKNKKTETKWDINPGSHDATAEPVPSPAALALAGVGLGVAVRMRRRFGQA